MPRPCMAPAHPRQATAARCNCWPAWITPPAVLAQCQVSAPEEVSAFASLLAGLDVAGVVVTAYALQTHAEAAIS
jgi:hypothetical protein